MSVFQVNQYQAELEKIIHFGGSKKETAIRNAFYNLLNEYAKQKGLMLIPEISLRTPQGKIITPDGTLKDSLRQDWGYWESKDEADNIDEEIKKKFDKDYPKDNILFEDSSTAVLIQSGVEIGRVSMLDAVSLDRLINNFVNFQRPEVANFYKAIELFKQDVPKVTASLKSIILSQEHNNKAFCKREASFWEMCKESINPTISLDDIREMIIQHILTEDIFNTIFDETQFHRENNIARELEQVIQTFFTGAIKRSTFGSIEHYYKAINASAAQIADHHEKQKFLKVVYETFYKGYNPKAADRLGVVYTPNEIVKFMIESTDYLLHEYFGKGLEDKGVDILDPATGTGTFICDIIDYIRNDKLAYKYENEIHANEIAILPYYIANLNIEFTYKQKSGNYKEFESLCFVDTLENLGFGFEGKQNTMFAVSAENAARIKRQNEKKISVVIGNPPYNANQINENENNKNKAYTELDKRIKDTFIKESTAQKTKVYDMYARFYRWAIDRLDGDGVIAFVTNRSFIESRTFDGFRKVIASEFNRIFIIDLGGDVRMNPKLSGTKHNVFGIQTGIAIAFMVRMNNVIEANSSKEFRRLKREYAVVQEPIIKYESKEYLSTQGTYIGYYRRPEFETAAEKLQFLSYTKLPSINFENIEPDKSNNWINQSEKNDWEQLLLLSSKSTKNSKSLAVNSLIKYYSTGVLTSRDEWLYSLNSDNLTRKIQYYSKLYSRDLTKWLKSNKSKSDLIEIQNSSEFSWSDSIRSSIKQEKLLEMKESQIRDVLYRPFNKRKLYFDSILCNTLSLQANYFPNQESKNLLIWFAVHPQIPFSVGSSNNIIDHGIASRISQSFPLYYYEQGTRLDNITDWGLHQFVEHYNDCGITKENIFYYIYATLHYPSYIEKYELNLKRDFPKIPFYDNFQKWANWGKDLMELHINYENVQPYELSIESIVLKTHGTPRPKLKADKDKGLIFLDEATIISGIPKQAWLYKLGNRSALEWILDQYKEKKSLDPTISEKFNTYKFSDYKDQVLDLLKRVCTVSVKTMEIISEMSK